jgi:hypothetical protein
VRSIYHVPVSPSKELLEQYGNDPIQTNILPLIDRKLNYSHKPRRSVLASYERLSEYGDLSDNTQPNHQDPSSKTMIRKSKMPLNAILCQQVVDEADETLTTGRGAKDTDLSLLSAQKQSLFHADPLLENNLLIDGSGTRKDYFRPAESSFKLVEPKKFNTPKASMFKHKNRPSKFSEAVAQAHQPAESSYIKIENPEIMPKSSSSLKTLKEIAMVRAEPNQLLRDRGESGGFMMKPPHKSYLDIALTKSETKRNHAKVVSRTALGGSSSKGSVTSVLDKTYSYTSSRNSSIKKIHRGLDRSWGKIYGMPSSTTASVEGSVVLKSTKHLLGKKYIVVDESGSPTKNTGGYMASLLKKYEVQHRSKKDVILSPGGTSEPKPKVPMVTIPSQTLPQLSSGSNLKDAPSNADHQILDECFLVANNLREILMMLIKFAGSYNMKVDTLLQEIFSNESGERGFRMIVRNILGPDAGKVRADPEQRVDLLKIMEFMNINHGRWKSPEKSQR